MLNTTVLEAVLVFDGANAFVNKRKVDAILKGANMVVNGDKSKTGKEVWVDAKGHEVTVIVDAQGKMNIIH